MGGVDGNVQEVAQDAEGEDGHRKGVAAVTGVVSKDLGDGLIVVLCAHVCTCQSRDASYGVVREMEKKKKARRCVPDCAAMLHGKLASSPQVSRRRGDVLPKCRIEQDGRGGNCASLAMLPAHTVHVCCI